VSYRFLLGDRNFLGLVAIAGFSISSFFVYLASSSFILIDHYGLSPSVYSLFFSINAVAFIGMSQLTGTLADRFGLARVVRIAVAGFATTMVVLAVVTSAGVDRLDVMAALLFIGYGFVGLVIPSTSVLAMEEHGTIAGTASALMGTLHFAIGALAMGVSGLFFDGTPLPMILGIATCAVIAFGLTQVTLGRRAPARIEVPAE
jgi:DHA1 family bicyclomycin/chloramphenicol resistance-like MFS transporter